MGSKKQVKVGNVLVGGGAQVSVQSMLNVPSTDIEGSVKQAVELAEAQQDYVTRDLVQEILEKEEEYWDWLDTQLDLIKNVGIENYIQSQI